jgi:SAM-dependent methyltransferase
LNPRHAWGTLNHDPEENSSNIGRGGYGLHAAAFDELAGDYDTDFTRTALGSALRAVVWSRTDEVFARAQRILDLGCGTGEDALRLAARGASVLGVDAAAAMVAAASEKARHAGCEARAQFRCLPIEQLNSGLSGETFDGVLSNFGALNCVNDLSQVAADLATKLVPGARLLWVMMGRYVPWEWGWYLLHADPARAVRRLRGSTGWRGMRISYPSPRTVTHSLRPYFSIDAVRPLGIALPPSYAAAWLGRRPRTLRWLSRAEEFAQKVPVLAQFADHYLIEATRLQPAAACSATRSA